jgi:NAD(P)-dependent dehydrogenase (short-subunit alcohol dehydrogenase family)
VVVSSVQGFFGQPGRTSYAASKAAMIGYFDGLRAELAKSGVGVTVVAPGALSRLRAASA